MRSMTGFGRARVACRKGTLTVELKTVNHKFLDVSIKLPEYLQLFEDRVKDMIQERTRRGKIMIHVNYDGALLDTGYGKINEERAAHYYKEMLKLVRSLGIKTEPTIADLLALPGVIDYSAEEERALLLWPRLKEALEIALDRLVIDREKEGQGIGRDLKKCARIIEKNVVAAEKRSHLTIKEYRTKFAEKVKALSNGQAVDKGRLEAEVAIYAKNIDIFEEISRLKSHLANFKKTINDRGEVGKKLDFIAQELHREANTIGSKAGDFKISKNTIEMKSEVEKIREQVKNLE